MKKIYEDGKKFLDDFFINPKELETEEEIIKNLEKEGVTFHGSLRTKNHEKYYIFKEGGKYYSISANLTLIQWYQDWIEELHWRYEYEN